MFDSEAIIKSIRSSSDKDSKAYKVTKYYIDLTSDTLDEGGKVIATSKLKNIEKHLLEWQKKHPNNGTIMQPEEMSLGLIHDLREKGLLE